MYTNTLQQCYVYVTDRSPLIVTKTALSLIRSAFATINRQPFCHKIVTEMKLK